MTQRIIHAATALVAVLGIAALATSVAVSQDDESKPKQNDAKKTEGKKTDEKKPAPKAVEVHIKVSVKDGGELPANTKIEISGRETACGSLRIEDATSTTNEKGEAVFKSLPVCKVLVKANPTGYMNKTFPFDLSEYRGPIQLELEREH